MRYYSTNDKTHCVSLKEAVISGFAPDNGLYMPEQIPTIPKAFFKNMANMTLQEISYVVANTLLGQDIDSDFLKDTVYKTVNFDIPLEYINNNKYSLELYHGPTLSFKDVGARFMARLTGHFNRSKSNDIVNVLVATSGDTGSAVANGFLDVPGVRVFVLYPHGKISKLQQAQFNTLGNNITAIEVNGSYEDCRSMVKNAFIDEELNEAIKLTSANSINVARCLPQIFYYFYAVAQLSKREQPLDNIIFATPSGNLGNVCSAIIAKRMGLPIKRIIAAHNSNDVFCQYLKTGVFTPKKAVKTIAGSIDVGNPTNFPRIKDLYNNNVEAVRKDISAYSYTDEQIAETLQETYHNEGYLLDPHGAVAYRALLEDMQPNEIGVFIETEHPAKSKVIVERIIGTEIEIPEKLKTFMNSDKKVVKMSSSYTKFKQFLLSAMD